MIILISTSFPLESLLHDPPPVWHVISPLVRHIYANLSLATAPTSEIPEICNHSLTLSTADCQRLLRSYFFAVNIARLNTNPYSVGLSFSRETGRVRFANARLRTESNRAKVTSPSTSDLKISSSVQPTIIMSGLDVEALLDSTAANGANSQEAPSKDRDREREERHKGDRSERRDRDRYREGSRDRDRERKRRDRSRDRRRDKDGDEDMNSPKSDRASANGSHRSRKRSRSRESDRRHSRRDRHGDDSYRGDFYRGSRHGRSRSKSPVDDRYYRPGVNGRGRRDEGEPELDRPRSRREDDRKRRRSPSPKKRAKSKTPEPQLTEDERDRRTVFVQQLAARLRTKELIQFFEKVGPVKEAQIVKDRVSGRSKGSVSFLSGLIRY
jgi:RNA recognition motif. (a.k.a. RRM, RBD, or RNP domain)